MTRLPTAIVSAALLVGVTVAAQSNGEDFARRQYESGIAFMQNGRFGEAVKDFQSVLDGFPNSAVADNALLEIAYYQLDLAHDITAAQTSVDALLKKYPDTDSAPMAHVLAGRVALARGRTPANVDAALASFERVPRLFPGDDAVPAAGFYAGETLRVVRRSGEALDRYRRVTMEYPRSIWAARADLAAGLCMVDTDRAPRALEELQRIRQQFPGSAEAAEALNENSILYRLYVRAPAQPAYTFGARIVRSDNPKFKDVYGMSVDPSGRLLLGHNQGVSIFDLKGTLLRMFSVEDASAFTTDDRGRVVIARKDALITETGESTPVAVPQQDGKLRQVEEIPSWLTTARGERLIADRKGKNVIRASASGKFLGVFANINAVRLASNRLEDVAILDRDSKGILILDRDGKAIGAIQSKGTGYEFDNPIDLAFDVFGHLYVLDRGRSSIFVFGPKNRLITTVTFPDNTPGAFTRAQAMAIDAAGRLYVFDDRAPGVQMYH